MARMALLCGSAMIASVAIAAAQVPAERSDIPNFASAEFGWQPASRLTISPYPEITWRLTTAVKF